MTPIVVPPLKRIKDTEHAVKELKRQLQNVDKAILQLAHLAVLRGDLKKDSRLD